MNNYSNRMFFGVFVESKQFFGAQEDKNLARHV